MIDREQVLHVARLARLRLTADEVERMSSELSTILDHIERINELDLDSVEPTSHVVEVENVLRADEPRESWPRELSTILDHIERINELDLESVEPTSHVVEVENVLRADEPRESWPRDRTLGLAPDADDDGFRVPSPGQ